jgi:hypothetical protein
MNQRHFQMLVRNMVPAAEADFREDEEEEDPLTAGEEFPGSHSHLFENLPS